MQQLYEGWYRKNGIRRVDQLNGPPLSMLQTLEFPKRSFWHYVGGDVGDMAPPGDDFIFRNLSHPVMLGFVTELGGDKGSPTRLAVQVASAITSYHTRNRRVRKMKALESAVSNENALVAYSYGLLPRMYRYQRSFYSEYYRWWNIQASVWKQVAEVGKSTDRHQFIMATLPRVLPSIAMLRKATGDFTQELMKVFNEPSSMFLLEIWKWLGEDRETSLLAGVPEDAMGRVNVIYQESGRWFALNLGLLNSWRKSSKKELAYAKENPTSGFVPKVKGFEPKAIQLRFLKLLVLLFETRSVAGDAGTETPATDPKSNLERTATVVAPEVPVLNPKTGVFEVKTQQVDVESSPEEAAAVAGATSTADDVVHSADDDAKLEEELSALALVRQSDVGADEPVIESQGERPLESAIIELCDEIAEQGGMSAKEYKRYIDLANSYRKIPSPDGVGTLADYIKIDPELLLMPESPKMPDIPGVLDKTMLSSSLLEFDSKYINKVMQKEIAGAVVSAFQNGGVAVTDYKVERVEQITGNFYSYEVKLAPVEGAAGTFRFKIAEIDETGEWEANCTKYRLRKQAGDVPIRKVSPERVALTSYYGKSFVSRSRKVVNNYSGWLTNQVRVKALSDDFDWITDLRSANVFDNEFECPRTYSTMAMSFRGFTLKGFDFNFDHTKRVELYTSDAIAKYEKDGSVLCGRQGLRLVLMDPEGELYIIDGDVVTEFVPLEQLLELDLNKAPVEFCEMTFGSRDVPVGFVLAHEMGLTRLMRLLKVQPRRVPAGSRVSLEAHEYAVVFADETLVFLRDDRMAASLLAGFNQYHAAIRRFAAHEFDRKGVYFSVLDQAGGGARTLRAIKNFYKLFVDQITRDLLVEMGEPTDVRGLLLRSAELLLTDQHPLEMDGAFMRIKGYERIAGHVYSTVVQGLREHSAQPGRSRQPIDINPYAVWKAIATDAAGAQVADINPVQNLKEQEAATTSGTGGRGSRSMTKKTRGYSKASKGTISEGTVDSGDVAINFFLSGDPQFTSLRGMSRRYIDGMTGATALVSTSALLSPGSDIDDPKRVNFIGIQRSHAVACKGYRPLSVVTGAEQVLAQRNTDMFAFAAKQDGKIVELTDVGVVVEYADGTQHGVEIGRRYGSAAGLTIPHQIVCDMRVGQKFKAGHIVSYNSDFYARDPRNITNVLWKGGIEVKCAVYDSSDTLEDSSVISESTAALLTTRMTKVRTIVIRFDQVVNRLVKPDRDLEADDILCVIEDAVTADAGLFDEESLDTLRVLGSHMPVAKARGKVERIEVFYHGDKEDMSDSIRAMANASDRQLAQRLKARGKKVLTGAVDEGFRVEGTPLALDTVAIRVYITGDVPMGVGDKGVFMNQLKTVCGRVMDDTTTTEDGTQIGGIFGYKSVSDRIVNSPDAVGTTATLLKVIAKKAFDIYKGKAA